MKVSGSRRGRLRAMISQGMPTSEIISCIGVSIGQIREELDARVLYSEGVCFGNKTEAYFTEHQAMNMPVYSADDLEGWELETMRLITNKNK